MESVSQGRKGGRFLSHLDDGDQIVGRLTEFAAIDIEMCQLISLGTLIYQLTPSSHRPYAPKVSCRIECGVGRGG